jgi:sec-independent protein translocase protein TatB
MFGIGFEKLLTLAILAAVLIGPDKLPQFAVDAARFIQKIRNMSREALTELKSELGPEFAHLDIQDLHPKKFIANHLDDIAKDMKNLAEGSAADIAKIKEQARIDPDLL